MAGSATLSVGNFNSTKVTHLTIDAMAGSWAAALVTTLALMAVASFVAVVIGIPSAIAGATLAEAGGRRTGKTLFFCRTLVALWCAAMLFSIATPLILHAAAWESTAGKFGWLVKTVTGGNLIWVGWIHGVHGSAIVALLTFWATRNIPDPVQQHASIDLSRWAIWWRVRLPLARAWIVVSVVFVWLVAATEMSVADLHSVRTIADQFYLFHALDPTMTSVLMVLVLPLVLAVVPCSAWYLWGRRDFAIDMRSPDERCANERSPDERCANECSPHELGRGAILVSAVWLVGAVCVCQAAMFIGLLLQAGHTVRIEEGRAMGSWSISACLSSLLQAPSMFAREYWWTAQLALLTTLVVTTGACLLARFSRSNQSLAVVFDGLAVIVFFIPGPLVGMAVVRLFALELPLFETLATETLIPTMIAVGVRSFVVAYLIMRFAYAQISESVWQSARLDGGFGFRFLQLELPAIWPATVIAAVAAAMVSSGDVPATLPVLPPGVTTVGTRLFGLLHSGSRYQEAALAFWYFAGMLLIGTMAWIGVRKFRMQS